MAVYSDALVVLGTAGVVIPLVRRSGVSEVIGYLAAGAILGPLGLGSLVGAVLEAGRLESSLRPESLDALAGLDRDLAIDVFVTPT
jgi:hypothetical protein